MKAAGNSRRCTLRSAPRCSRGGRSSLRPSSPHAALFAAPNDPSSSSPCATLGPYGGDDPCGGGGHRGLSCLAAQHPWRGGGVNMGHGRCQLRPHPWQLLLQNSCPSGQETRRCRSRRKTRGEQRGGQPSWPIHNVGARPQPPVPPGTSIPGLGEKQRGIAIQNVAVNARRENLGLIPTRNASPPPELPSGAAFCLQSLFRPV